MKRKVEYLYLAGFSLNLVTLSLFYLRTVNPDTFWHIKVGQYIVHNLTIPKADIFSWSVYGEPWIIHQWLADVIMYLWFSSLNLYGIWIMVFLCALLTSIILFKGILLINANSLAAAIIAGATVFFLLGWNSPWPQVFAYIMFAVYLYLSLRNEWDYKAFYTVAVVSILWANVHSNAVLFPLLLLAESAWYYFTRLENTAKTSRRLMAAGIAFLGTLVSPHGINLWQYAIGEGLFSATYRQYIANWRPYDFGNVWFVFVFFICMFIIYYSIKHQEELSKLALMRALGFWALALLSRIYMPFAVMSTFLLLGYFNLETKRALSKKVATGMVFIGAATIIFSYIPNDLDKMAKNNYPVEAVQVIKDERYQNIFNIHEWGGYLMLNDIPVYMDGRNDVYKNIIGDYMSIVTGGVPISKSIKETGAETALLRDGSAVDMVLNEHEEWIEVYRDGVAVIYILER